MGKSFQHRTNRRRFVGGTAAAAASASVVGHTAAAPSRNQAPAVIRSQEDVTLEVWGFDEGRLAFVEHAATLAEFRDEYPNVTVNLRQFPFDEMHDKLLAALAGGRGAPDIAEVEIGRFSSFLRGDRVPFLPLGDRIGAEIRNLYEPSAVDPWSWDGEIYGLGNELNAVVLTYRADVLEELGIETPFETWEQVIAAGKEIVANNSEMKALAIHDIAWGDWFQMAQHAGGGLFDDSGSFIGDSEQSLAALEFLHDLIYEHEIAGIAPADAQNDWTGPAYWAAFQAERFAMLWGPPWHIGGLPINVPEQEGLWTAQPLPVGLGESYPTANFGGTGMCMTEQTEHPDVAWALIRAANLTVPGQLYDFSARTIYPTYVPAYEAPELDQPSPYFRDARLARIYQSIADELPPFYQSPYLAETTEALVRLVITPVMNDREEPEVALEELAAEVQEIME